MSGRKREFRAPRRRGFDDDFHPPEPASRRTSNGPQRPSPISSGPPVDATVKFFSAEKGFGFVSLANGGDAFLHISVLQAGGFDAVQPGTKLKVNVGQGQKGPQVAAVLEVDASTAIPQSDRGPRRDGPRPSARSDAPTGPAVSMRGTVKWFNATKGFGFASVEDGGKDVFIHISVLAKSGLQSLAEGQQVQMDVVQAAKGREAVSVNPID